MRKFYWISFSFSALVGMNEFFNGNYWYLISTWIVMFDLFWQKWALFFQVFPFSTLFPPSVKFFHDTVDDFVWINYSSRSSINRVPSLLDPKEPMGAFIYCVRKIYRKTNIFYPQIRTRTCAYHVIRNVSFSENVTNVMISIDVKTYLINKEKFINPIMPHQGLLKRSTKFP